MGMRAGAVVSRASCLRRRVNASAAATRSAAQRAPGRRPIRSIGPDTDTAAITAPRPSRTGAETLATPGSRSAALCAHPRLRTSASVRSVNFAAGYTACWVLASAKASSTLAPDPAVIGRRVPMGTVSRSPAGGSRAATQIRVVPSRR